MKTSYLFKGVLTLALAFVSSAFFFTEAQTTTVDGILYQLVTPSEGAAYAETAPVKSGDTQVFYTAASITVQANVTIGGTSYPVKRIGDNSMRECPNLTSISIPEGVEIIGNSAFAQCPLLPSVVLPASVNSIEAWAFYGCPKLTSINIPDGVTAIMEHTFQETGLTGVTLPASMTRLVYCAFQNANNLASINLENITEIGAWALYGTAITSANISNVFAIGSEAFRVCPNLETVTLTNVSSTGGWSFEGCPKLVSVNFGDLESIEVGSFSGCGALTSVRIPSSVVFIDGWAFEKTAITTIYASWVDPEGEAYIEGDAFGADAGKINFTWKVPATVKNAWGDTFMGYPVEIDDEVGIGNFQADATNAFYANGNLNLVNLDGYTVSVFTLDGRIAASIQAEGTNCIVPLALNNGIYLVNAVNGNERIATKIIVK